MDALRTALDSEEPDLSDRPRARPPLVEQPFSAQRALEKLIDLVASIVKVKVVENRFHSVVACGGREDR